MGVNSVSEVSDRTIDSAAEQNEKEINGARKEVGGKGDVEGMMEDSIYEKKIEEHKMEIDDEDNRKGEESMEQEIGNSRKEVGEGIDEMKIEASEAHGKVKLNKQKPESVRAGAKHGQDEIEFSEENGDKTKDTKMWFDRPIRQRKCVERLVLCVENKADREIKIEKGSGTKLKDIPNVAYMLSRKKNADALKLLHSILFSRRGKAAEIKHHVLRFSGFVWHTNEEKEKHKVRQKLDKCVKEKLLGICNILEIPVSKTKARKEDIIVKLMAFFEAPHATTSKLVYEKGQSSEGKKHKRSENSISAPGGTLSEQSSKKLKRNAIGKVEKQKSAAKSKNEFGKVEEEKGKAEDNGLLEKSSDEKFEQSESKEKEKESEGECEEMKGEKERESEEDKGEKERIPQSESVEEKGKRKRMSENKPSKKDLMEKVKSKEVKTCNKSSSKPSSKTKSKRSMGSDASGSIQKASLEKNTEGDKQQPPTWKMYSRKETAGKEVNKGESKKNAEGKNMPAEETPNSSEADKPQPPIAKKPSNKETAAMNVGEGKSKPAEEKPYPCDRLIQRAIRHIFQEASPDQLTFGHITSEVGVKLNMDPTPRLPSIELMILDQLSNKDFDIDSDDE